MKTLILSFGLFLFINSYGQTGINTKDPKATLDVNGNLIIRSVDQVTALTNEHSILIRDTSVAGDNEVKEINAAILFGGVNTTAYYASKTGSWSLLNLGLGNSWYKINLTGISDTRIGNPALFTTGVYTVAKPGVYVINYELQMESGINLEILGGKKMLLLKNNAIWDEKNFDAVRVAITVPPLGPTITLAAVPVTSTSLQSMAMLDAGDTITFAINTNGVLPVNLTLLTNAKVNLNVFRISD